MTSPDLVILGTASQAPTRLRNHNGYLLRWEGRGLLFDPGEGTQRQLAHAGVAASRITDIFLTHLHGDHCLGLSGVLQRMALDLATTPRVDEPISIHFPASGLAYVERLIDASIGRRQPVRLCPAQLPEPGAEVVVGGGDGGGDGEGDLRITGRRLDHPVDTIGWRVEEPAGRHFVVDRLRALGLAGPDVGELERAGSLAIGGRTVALADVTEPHRGRVFAIVMDTRVCDEALALALGADVLLCEATFLDAEQALAHDYGHLTARQAAWIGVEAGARRLVLSHFSGRYDDLAGHRAEAGALHPDVVVAEDLLVVAFPPR